MREAGIAEEDSLAENVMRVALHPLDQPLWRVHGGAGWFGISSFDPGPEPTVDLGAGMTLRLGELEFQVRHAPGHSPGHVIFYCREEKQAFCGDVIFDGGVGRTDLPGGDWEELLASIRQQILTAAAEIPPPLRFESFVGKWGLMGWGTYGWNGADGPNSMCAWSREQLGWIGRDNDRLVELDRDADGLRIEALDAGGAIASVTADSPPCPAASRTSPRAS